MEIEKLADIVNMAEIAAFDHSDWRERMITIGITTYNRLDIIRRMAKSLYESALPIEYSIRVYDDASTEFPIETLREIFPNAISVYRQKENLGADLNTFFMYKDFLNSNDAFLFNADSDLIFSRDWLSRALALLPKTDGVLSLFNTPSHRVKNISGNLCEKNDLGAAGTLFTRKRVEDICYDMGNKLQENSNSQFTIDWSWSEYFCTHGIRLFCTQESLVQHIGIWGQNSATGAFDFGTGFKVDTFHNGQTVNDLLEGFALSRYSDFPLSTYNLFPFKKINAGAKVLLYGAGTIGTRYYKLIQRTGYCKIVAWVDKNATECGRIVSPTKMREFNFAYILLATSKADIADSMRKDILSIDSSLSSKIVVSDNLH